MRYAYSSKAGAVVPTGLPEDWPVGWPVPDGVDGPWPPGWPKTGTGYTMSMAGATSLSIDDFATASVEGRILKAGLDTAELNGALVKVTAAIGAVAVNLKASAGASYASAIYLSVTNYEGAKYGVKPSLYCDVGAGQVGQTMVVTMKVLGYWPAVSGTRSVSVTASAVTLTLTGPSSIGTGDGESALMEARVLLSGLDTAALDGYLLKITATTYWGSKSSKVVVGEPYSATTYVPITNYEGAKHGWKGNVYFDLVDDVDALEAMTVRFEIVAFSPTVYATKAITVACPDLTAAINERSLALNAGTFTGTTLSSMKSKIEALLGWATYRFVNHKVNAGIFEDYLPYDGAFPLWTFSGGDPNTDIRHPTNANIGGGAGWTSGHEGPELVRAVKLLLWSKHKDPTNYTNKYISQATGTDSTADLAWSAAVAGWPGAWSSTIPHRAQRWSQIVFNGPPLNNYTAWVGTSKVTINWDTIWTGRSHQAVAYWGEYVFGLSGTTHRVFDAYGLGYTQDRFIKLGTLTISASATESITIGDDLTLPTKPTTPIVPPITAEMRGYQTVYDGLTKAKLLLKWNVAGGFQYFV